MAKFLANGTRPGCLACLIGSLMTCVAAVVAVAALTGGVAHGIGPRIPVGLVSVVVMLAAKGIIDWAASAGNPAPMIVATSVGAVVGAGALCAVAWNAVTAPIAELVGSDLVGLSGLETFVFVVGLVCLTPLAWPVAVVVSFWGLRSLARPIVARATLGAAVLTSAALFGLTSLALVRVSARPSIDCYLENSHAPGVELDEHARPFGPQSHWPPPPNPASERKYRTSVGDVTLVQSCLEWGPCSLNVVDGGVAPTLDKQPGTPDPIEIGKAKLKALRIAPDLLVVKRIPARAPYGFGAEEPSIKVFHRVESEWRDEPFRVELLIQRTNTPIAWIDFGLSGAVLILALWVLRTLVSIGERRTSALSLSSAGSVASVYRRLFVKAVDEPLASECHLLRVDAAIVAVACCSVAPLVTAALLGLLTEIDTRPES